MLENLENKFGQKCEFGRNFRTIEGDCNNLYYPSQGSAGTSLRRLGGNDPAYPFKNRNKPSGATDISPREISNRLFSSSPGTETLLKQTESLTECVEGATDFEQEITLCPLESVTIPSPDGELVIPIEEIKSNKHEDLVFVYSAPECTIEVLLKCSGETRIDFAKNPCGAKTNRFFDPLACTVLPAEDSVLANSAGLTDMFFTFGQFIDHDVGLTPTSQLGKDRPGFCSNSRPVDAEQLPIEIPEDDFHFSDQKEFSFERARFSQEHLNSHVNQISSYLDGSQIYGSNVLRARLLRSFQGGRLNLAADDYPAFNKVKGYGALGAVVENMPTTDEKFYVVGEVRGNEQSLLLSLHICFLREHNLVADELADLFPDYDDETLYQTAKAIVTAEYQSIIYNEWLPRLLGSTSPSSDDFYYDKTLDASVSAIFTTAAFRFGHTMVGNNLLLLEPGPRSTATMSLVPIRNVFFNPLLVTKGGLDNLLRGGAWHAAKEVDHKVVDELRNFLVTGEGGASSEALFDLVALNIQRARDMGLPCFNDIRELYNLPPYKTFSDFISDPGLADLASEVYKGNVDYVDTFFGGLVEKHVSGSQLGETFHAIISEQFKRLRDGDRFFYSGIKFDKEVVQKMPRLGDILENKIRLHDIIVRTTNVTAYELGKKPSVFQI